MKRFFCFLSVLLLGFTGPIYAQTGVITGRVVDEADEPLGGASVAVWTDSPSDTTLVSGAVTDESGRFRVAGLQGGTYRVTVSYVGFRTRTFPAVELEAGREGSMGDIRMIQDAALLEDVEVMAERERVQFETDRTSYNVSDDATLSGSSATEALETIPSVEVDIDGNVSLRGQGNVAIHINGRPAPVSSEFLPVYLKSLPADAIERIEVIPNPNASQDPEGMGGILNIVMKDETDIGLGATFTAGVDTEGSYNASALATYGTGPLTLSATYGLRDFSRGSEGDRLRINRTQEPLTTLLQDFEGSRGGLSHYGSLNADLQLTTNTVFTANVQGGIQGRESDEFRTYIEMSQEENILRDDVRLSEETDDDWNVGARFSLTHDFEGSSMREQGRGMRGRRRHRGRRGGGSSTSLGEHAFSVEAGFEMEEDQEEESFVEGPAGNIENAPIQQRTTGDEKEREFEVRADYAVPIGGFRVEAGVDLEWERNEEEQLVDSLNVDTGVWEQDDERSSIFDLTERTQSAYLQVARQVGPVGLQAGLRMESAQYEFVFGTPTTDPVPVEKDYWSLFPSAFATYQLTDDDQFRVGYSRRIRRPRSYFLNPIPNFDDPLFLRIGNPDLEPEYTDSFEATYSRYLPFGSLSVTPYYRRTTGVIRRIQDLREDGVTVSTFENLDTSSSSGLEVVGTTSVGDLRTTVSLEGYRVQTDGTNADMDLQNDAFGWGGRINVSYSFGNQFGIGDTDIQANAFYRAPMDTEQGRVGSRTYINVALQQALFGDRASLTIRASDPFGLAGFYAVTDDPTLYQEFERTWGAQRVGFTFSYTIGRRGDEQGRRQTGEEENTGFEGLEY